MNQRVMIAMAIACNPKLLIADEPTTALDVTIQAQILDLLLQLQRERGMALVLITHDMGVVAETARARRGDVCGPGRWRSARRPRCSPTPQHPYTAALLAALPERERRRAGWRRSPAWCRASYDRPRGLPVRAALRLRDRRCRARCRPDAAAAGTDGLVRCHYPLGDAPRERRIAADEPRMARARESCHDAVVDATTCTRDYAVQPRPVRASRRSCRRSAASRSRSTPGGRWRWSANRAAASRRSRAW